MGGGGSGAMVWGGGGEGGGWGGGGGGGGGGVEHLFYLIVHCTLGCSVKKGIGWEEGERGRLLRKSSIQRLLP